MKKVLGIVLASVLVLSMMGCASKEEVSATQAPAQAQSGNVQAAATNETNNVVAAVSQGKDINGGEPFKIAYVACDLGTVNNQKWDKGCQAALEGYPNATYTAWDCESDSEKCNQILQELINQDYDGIFLHPVDASGQAGMVEACEAAGINVVTINLEVATTYSCFVGRPDYEQGVTLARTVAGMMGNKGNVVVIGPPVAMMETYQRDDAFIDTMKAEFPDITVLEEVCGDWSTESGNQITRDFITKYGNDIQAVMSCNDSMAFGAVQALQAAGMEGVIVTGSDGQDQAMEYILSGDMSVTLLQDSVYNAKIGTCMLLELIQNGHSATELAKTPRINIPMIEVTKANIDKYYTPAQ